MIGSDRSGLTRRNVPQESPRPTFEANRVVKAVQSLDAYPKVMEDYVTGSTSGGVITFLCAFICFLLFLSEYTHHRTTVVKSELKVDTVGVHKEVANAERLRVNIDVTFHALSCELITLDTMDQAGEAHHDVHDGHLKKRRLDRHGEPIENEYKMEPANKHKDLHKEIKKIIPQKEEEGGGGHGHGGHSHGHGHRRSLQGQQEQIMPLQGLNFFNLQDLLAKQFPNGVEKAFQNEDKEGCEVIGYLEVNRVPGSFSVSPGKSLQIGFAHIQLNVRTELNMTHTINKFSFGDGFPGFVSPLDGTNRELPSNAVHQYFLKVVPTSFLKLKGEVLSTHQYSVTESSSKAEGFLNGGSRPSGVYFHYELSPIRVDYKEHRNTVSEFLTSVCAIVGGVATISGLIQSGVQMIVSYAKSSSK